MLPVETPDIENDKAFNLLTSIWIVPVIALIISGWLVYQHFIQLGSEIRIDFPSSNGLAPGSSTVKFRDVTVGKVTRIMLQKDGDGVTVIVRMNREANPFLNTSTKFWIVKAQVDSSGVQGLDTILNGAYISMRATKQGEPVKYFKGLDKPFRAVGDGKMFHLSSTEVGNIQVGAPVYYKNMQAGSIESIHLSSDMVTTRIDLFIKKRFVGLINSSTKFWHQDLVTLSFENGEIGLNLAPLSSMMLGSIKFDTRLDRTYPQVSDKHIFHLFAGRKDAYRVRFVSSQDHKRVFRFVFAGEVKGLHEGTKIKYNDFEIGQIDTLEMHYDPQRHKMVANAVGKMDTAIFKDKKHNGMSNLAKAVREGLHAELKSANLMSKDLYVDLTFAKEDNNTRYRLVARKNIIDFPTKENVSNEVLSELEHLISSFADLADENKGPLRDLLLKLNESAKHLNELMSKQSFLSLTDDLNRTMGSINGFTDENGDLNKAIDELRKTLKTTKQVMQGYSSSSLFGKKLEAMLKELGRTSEETKSLIRKLNNKPNSLIFGD